MASKASKGKAPRTEDPREAYRRIRSLTPMDRADFDAACKALNPDSPAAWVEAARTVAARVVVPCERCGGTGQYVTGMVNGKLTGPGGACFRCAGKGKQTAEDRERNYWYDCAAMNRAARAMMGGA